MKAKQAKLLLIIMLVLLSNASSTKLKHKLKITNEENKIIIYYETPCDDASSLVKDPSNKYATSMLECNYGYKHSNFMFQQCKNHYQQNWVLSLKDLATCSIHYLAERDVIDIIQSPSIISVATNLLKSIFVSGEKESIVENIKNEYNINTNLHLNIMRDSITVSNKNVREQDALASNQMPADVWGFYHAHRSIAQKSALIRTITRTCKETGALDTRAVSELTENPNFLQQHQNSTRITNIKVDFEKSKIIITYQLKQEVTVEEDEPEPQNEPEPKIPLKHTPSTLDPNLILFTVSLLILVIILIINAFAIYKCLNKPTQPENIEMGHRRPSMGSRHPSNPYL